ncbi:MAG TPA: hypothetical protein VLG48_07145 [Candidatus Methylomirabilis sp.]|nr:hypothetical protein [Candidatus Methylomirabilis sp.]
MEAEKEQGSGRGLKRLEVWLFVAISMLGLFGFMSTLSTSDGHGVAGSEEFTASLYAQEKLEELIRQPFTSGPLTGSLAGLEPGFTGTFRIIPVASGASPRLARITVSVRWTPDGAPAQTVTLERTRTE